MECNVHERGISCKICSYSVILYQRKRLAYFSNQIAITFDLANKGKLVNWCSIVLTQFLVELTHWIESQKKTTANLISSKTKKNNYYSRAILNILYRKWFPLSKVHSPIIPTPKELVSPTSQEC
jgi:hypothetical protein